MSRWVIASMLTDSLQEIMLRQTSLPLMASISIWLMRPYMERASDLLVLLPRSRRGMLLKEGLVSDETRPRGRRFHTVSCKNYSELTNFRKLTRIEWHNGK